MITLRFSYTSRKGTSTKEIHTADTPLLALMKFFGKFGTVLSAKTIDGSIALIEYDNGSVVVFDISVEGKRGPRSPL